MQALGWSYKHAWDTAHGHKLIGMWWVNTRGKHITSLLCLFFSWNDGFNRYMKCNPFWGTKTCWQWLSFIVLILELFLFWPHRKGYLHFMPTQYGKVIALKYSVVYSVLIPFYPLSGKILIKIFKVTLFYCYVVLFSLLFILFSENAYGL